MTTTQGFLIGIRLQKLLPEVLWLSNFILFSAAIDISVRPALICGREVASDLSFCPFYRSSEEGRGELMVRIHGARLFNYAVRFALIWISVHLTYWLKGYLYKV